MAAVERSRSEDLVIGDETGVVGVPAERALEVLAVAEELSGKHYALVAGLAAGGDFGALTARLRHL
jgi:regulator of RNase E activity RraA